MSRAKASAEAPLLFHVFSTFAPAGPELRTVRLINSLGNEFRHRILAIDGRVDAARELAPGVDARLVEPPPRAGTPRTVLALRRIMRAELPEVVLSYNWGAFDAVLASRSLGLVHIHHEDGFTAEEAQAFKRRRELARRLLLPGVFRVVVPSQRLIEIARERWGLPAAKLLLLPNGVELDRFRPGREQALRARLGLPAGAVLVGWVGHLRPEKRPDRLLEALAQLGPEVHALLLGEGPERPALEARAASPPLAGRVHLVGHQADAAPWYRAMDLLAISSDTEQLPLALLEAMASGLPVASTAVGDVARVLPSEQGPLVVPREAKALAEALGRLARDGGLRERLGRRNRENVARHHAFEPMRAAYRELWAEAARLARARARTAPPPGPY